MSKEFLWVILLDKLLTLNLAHELSIGHGRTNVRELRLAIFHLANLSQDKLSALQILVPIYFEIGMMTEELFLCLGGSKAIPLLFVEPLHLIHLLEYGRMLYILFGRFLLVNI